MKENHASGEGSCEQPANEARWLWRLVRPVRIFFPVAAIVLLRLPCVLSAWLGSFFEWAALCANNFNEYWGLKTPGIDNYVDRAHGHFKWVTPSEKLEAKHIHSPNK